MIVVPYPHAGGHQRANALRLVEAGAARLIDERFRDAWPFLDAAWISTTRRHAAMSAAARGLGRPAAADAVAAILLASPSRPIRDAATADRIARGAGA
jgi:UDP-N-acetylglucosamine:LPS N-acetylglucosamine transferase